jgi:cell division inhibitor SulA
VEHQGPVLAGKCEHNMLPRTVGDQTQQILCPLCASLHSAVRAGAVFTPEASTIRRWLPAAGLVWRRAAPTLRIRDPHKEEKMAAIHEALAKCRAENPVFYEDEVDIHLTPKIGAD